LSVNPQNCWPILLPSSAQILYGQFVQILHEQLLHARRLVGMQDSSVHAFQIVGKFATPESRDSLSIFQCFLRSQLPLCWPPAASNGGTWPIRIGVRWDHCTSHRGLFEKCTPRGLLAAQHPSAVLWLGEAGPIEPYGARWLQQVRIPL